MIFIDPDELIEQLRSIGEDYLAMEETGYRRGVIQGLNIAISKVEQARLLKEIDKKKWLRGVG